VTVVSGLKKKTAQEAGDRSATKGGLRKTIAWYEFTLHCLRWFLLHVPISDAEGTRQMTALLVCQFEWKTM